MKVCVVGLWHLGTVTAGCLAAAGLDVTGLDDDASVIDALTQGRPPLFEPGLEELLNSGLASGRLRFTTDPRAAAGADIVWIAFDTPVDDDDRADVAFVIDRVTKMFPHLANDAFVLLSSQVPVGTTRQLERAFSQTSNGRRVGFGYSPENLRLGNAIAVFTRPDRVVAGVRNQSDREMVARLFQPFTERIEWMSVESAEMTKHALNAFLATSITFINEIATLSEQVGADASEVERGLKSEARIGPKAYLSPGGAFAGGTLARDIAFLSDLGGTTGVPTHLLSSVKVSNDAHRTWAARRLDQSLKGVSGKSVAVWGLTYKPGTDTLRRSSAVELCRWLVGKGATVRAHDPAVRTLPSDLVDRVSLADSPIAASDGAQALVIATPWPEYAAVGAAELSQRMLRPLVLDANRFAARTLGADPGIEYISVGRGSVAGE
jgi:UDPglucose 6-dehydrogenase